MPSTCRAVWKKKPEGGVKTLPGATPLAVPATRMNFSLPVPSIQLTEEVRPSVSAAAATPSASSSLKIRTWLKLWVQPKPSGPSFGARLL